jgi:hypothetical protein
MRDKILLATHLYKGHPVRLIELTYQDKGEQYCTIEMINGIGHIQRQTIQERHLSSLAISADGQATPSADPCGEEKATP